jgi:hypothetical protein
MHTGTTHARVCQGSILLYLILGYLLVEASHPICYRYCFHNPKGTDFPPHHLLCSLNRNK